MPLKRQLSRRSLVSSVDLDAVTKPCEFKNMFYVLLNLDPTCDPRDIQIERATVNKYLSAPIKVILSLDNALKIAINAKITLSVQQHIWLTEAF